MGLRSPRQISLGLNKTLLKLDFFGETLTVDSAYYLGYVVADGTVSSRGSRPLYQLRLKCVKTDGELIRTFRRMVGSNHLLKTIPGYIGKDGRFYKEALQIQITKDSFVRPLVEIYGVLPNKSNLDIKLPKVPDGLMAHFARGFLDGDGCVTKSSKSNSLTIYWLGSPLMIEMLQERIISLTGVSRKKISERKDTRLHQITWSHREDLQILRGWLYPEGEYPSLKRKEKKLVDFLDKFPNKDFTVLDLKKI